MFRENVVIARCIFFDHEILDIRRLARTWQTVRGKLLSDIRVMNETLFLECKTHATGGIVALVSEISWTSADLNAITFSERL